jgi:hypothetical protein
MTKEEKLQQRKEKLQQRLSYLLCRLHDETIEEHKKINNMGWGHAMRCV